MDLANDIIGRGWGFPPEFYDNGDDLRMVDGEQDIRESLYILLSTSLKERVMRPNYGCNLQDYLFEEADEALLKKVQTTVNDAILLHESRINLISVNTFFDENTDGLLIIDVTFSIVQTNSQLNMVYPFYITEASTVNV